MNNDPLFWNKIAGAILSAGLLAMAAGFVAHHLYHPRVPEKPAFIIAGGGAEKAEAGKKEAPSGPAPIAALLAKADPAKGEKVAKKCIACHSFEKGGPNKIGPNLYNVVGRKAGTHEGFNFSGAMKEHGEWTYDALNHFLYSPKDVVKGTKMTFAGLKKTEDLVDLIAYLRTLSESPKPLP